MVYFVFEGEKIYQLISSLILKKCRNFQKLPLPWGPLTNSWILNDGKCKDNSEISVLYPYIHGFIRNLLYLISPNGFLLHIIVFPEILSVLWNPLQEKQKIPTKISEMRIHLSKDFSVISPLNIYLCLSSSLAIIPSFPQPIWFIIARSERNSFWNRYFLSKNNIVW